MENMDLVTISASNGQNEIFVNFEKDTSISYLCFMQLTRRIKHDKKIECCNWCADTIKKLKRTSVQHKRKHSTHNY